MFPVWPRPKRTLVAVEGRSARFASRADFGNSTEAVTTTVSYCATLVVVDADIVDQSCVRPSDTLGRPARPHNSAATRVSCDPRTDRLVVPMAISYGRKAAGQYISDHADLLHPLWSDEVIESEELAQQLLFRATVFAKQVQHDTITDLLRLSVGHFDPVENGDVDKRRMELAASVNFTLDFEVLPQGSSIRTLAESIARRSSHRHDSIDLLRVQVLDELKQAFGEKRCALATGRRRGKSYENPLGRNIDEDYILLVIRNYGEDDDVLSEDAIAISPIAGQHATFYSRFASSGVPWREAFAQSKKDARELGVRRLQFKGRRDGLDEYFAMRSKLLALNRCDAGDFYNDFRYLADEARYEVQQA